MWLKSVMVMILSVFVSSGFHHLSWRVTTIEKILVYFHWGFLWKKEDFVLKWGAPVVQPIGEGRILVEAVESWPGSALIFFGRSRAHDVAINRWQLEAIRLLITPTWIYSLQARQEIAAKRCHFPNLLRQKNQQFRLIFLECSQFWWDWTCSLLVGAPHMLPTITSREYFLTSLVWEGKFDLF